MCGELSGLTHDSYFLLPFLGKNLKYFYFWWEKRNMELFFTVRSRPARVSQECLSQPFTTVFWKKAALEQQVIHRSVHPNTWITFSCCSVWTTQPANQIQADSDFDQQLFHPFKPCFWSSISDLFLHNKTTLCFVSRCFYCVGTCCWVSNILHSLYVMWVLM